MLGKFAVAAGVALSLSLVAAVPLAVAQNAPRSGAAAGELPPYYDLGIDVTKLPTNPEAARRYFATLAPETQQVLLASCRNYLAHPLDAQMPETLLFCAAIVAGLG